MEQKTKKFWVKNIIILLFAVVVMILGLRFFSGEDNWVCKNGNWEKHGNPSSPMPSDICEGQAQVNKKIELCFAQFSQPNVNDLYDKYTLRMLLDGDKVSGELKFLPAEKDSKVGKFEGTVSAVDKVMMARTADLWWDTFGEGISAKEQLRIIFGEGTASLGAGELVDRGDGVYVYKDIENLHYDFSLTDVSCQDLTERDNVENYIKKNISTLSPVKAVLGGTWYVNSVIINLINKTGIVRYEDGHISERKSFTYTVNEKGEVLNLSFQSAEPIKPIIDKNPVKNTYNKTTCEKDGGDWIAGYNVCEINSYSKTECETKGGEFNECASACRYQPEATVCTMQCVLTCTFK